MIRIFTYGTLMKGYHNHRYLRGFEPQEGVLESYRRVWPKNRGFPVIVEDKSGCWVSGEVYTINFESLKRIDVLEGAPNFYYRKKKLIRVGPLRSYVVAWVYLPTEFLLREWLDAEKDHGNYLDGLKPNG